MVVSFLGPKHANLFNLQCNGLVVEMSYHFCLWFVFVLIEKKMICEFKIGLPKEETLTIVVVAFWSTPLPPLAAVGQMRGKLSRSTKGRDLGEWRGGSQRWEYRPGGKENMNYSISLWVMVTKLS